MFDKWLSIPAHFYLRIAALFILAIGVSTSNLLMSIGTIWLLVNWLLEGNFDTKLLKIKSSYILWLFLFIFFMVCFRCFGAKI